MFVVHAVVESPAPVMGPVDPAGGHGLAGLAELGWADWVGSAGLAYTCLENVAP